LPHTAFNIDLRLSDILANSCVHPQLADSPALSFPM
jgi:hypothetical protein